MKLLELLKELKKISFEERIMEEILAEMEPNEAGEPIEVGSRVNIKWKTTPAIKGRVHSIGEDGSFYINRDGFSGLIKLGTERHEEHIIENLSYGYYGKLDKKLWIAKKRIKEIEISIKQQIGSDPSQITLLIKEITK